MDTDEVKAEEDLLCKKMNSFSALKVDDSQNELQKLSTQQQYLNLQSFTHALSVYEHFSKQ